MNTDEMPTLGPGDGPTGRQTVTMRETLAGVLFFVLIWTATGIVAILLIWLLQIAGLWALPEGDVEPTASAVVDSLAGRLRAVSDLP